MHTDNELWRLIDTFMQRASQDARLAPSHIALYLSLVFVWYTRGCKTPLVIFRKDLVVVSKISGSSTYHRCIKQLHAYGYIRYEPSFSRVMGSEVYL